MSSRDRAAQFSPFAALTGYEAGIDEARRLTESCPEPTEEQAAEIDRALRHACSPERPAVEITFFCPDEYKAGGTVMTAAGKIKKADPAAGKITMEDMTEIYICDIIGAHIIKED